MNKIIEQAHFIFFDTTPLIYLLKMDSEYYPLVSEVLDFIYSQNRNLLLSQTTLFEISKKAYLAGDKLLPIQYRKFFENSSNVFVCKVDSETILKASEIAAKNDFDFCTSLKFAEACVNGADCFITNSKNLKDFTEIPILNLKEIL